MTPFSPTLPTTEARAEHPALVWWRRLRSPRGGDPGALAQLRRARSTLEAMQVREAIVLARSLGAVRPDVQAPDWKVRAALDLARALAQVKEHDPTRHPMQAAGWKRFAGARKESDAGDDRPLLAESRFRRLLQTGDGEEKVTAFTRLVVLLGGTVKVDALARDFLFWNHPDLGERIRERWAFLYYHAVDAAPSALFDPDFNSHPDTEDNT